MCTEGKIDSVKSVIICKLTRTLFEGQTVENWLINVMLLINLKSDVCVLDDLDVGLGEDTHHAVKLP